MVMILSVLLHAGSDDGFLPPYPGLPLPLHFQFILHVKQSLDSTSADISEVAVGFTRHDSCQRAVPIFNDDVDRRIYALPITKQGRIQIEERAKDSLSQLIVESGKR